MNLHQVPTVNGEQWNFQDSDSTYYYVTCANHSDRVRIWTRTQDQDNKWRLIAAPARGRSIRATASWIHDLFTDTSLAKVD